jgi:hypothetical protein
MQFQFLSLLVVATSVAAYPLANPQFMGGMGMMNPMMMGGMGMMNPMMMGGMGMF